MTTFGRIDVHSHLIPGVDDGCQTLTESIACARKMVEAGYTHMFVTPHVWPNLKHIGTDSIVSWAQTLQAQLDAHGVALTVMPGGEINLIASTQNTPRQDLVTYGMEGRYALMDLWADRLPVFFEPTTKWFHSIGVQPILAHPERMRAVQENPELADDFARMGVLLQGNLQCLSDAPHAATRIVMERYLKEDRYFLLGSDLHKLDTLGIRLNGLRRAIDLVGDAKVDELTRHNPRQLLASR